MGMVIKFLWAQFLLDFQNLIQNSLENPALFRKKYTKILVGGGGGVKGVKNDQNGQVLDFWLFFQGGFEFFGGLTPFQYKNKNF